MAMEAPDPTLDESAPYEPENKREISREDLGAMLQQGGRHIIISATQDGNRLDLANSWLLGLTPHEAVSYVIDFLASVRAEEMRQINAKAEEWQAKVAGAEDQIRALMARLENDGRMDE